MKNISDLSINFIYCCEGGSKDALVSSVKESDVMKYPSKIC